MAVKDHLGNEHASTVAMCAAWKVPRSTFSQRVNRMGLTLEQALTRRDPRESVRTDHTGREYASENTMCAAWGVNRATFRSRIENGWDVERALTEPKRNTRPAGARTGPVTDHDGHVFNNEKDMCMYWGVKQETFRQRMRTGYSLADALTRKPDPSRQGAAKRKPVKDHTGREFRSMSAMCAAYGTNRSTVTARLARGDTLEQALTKPSRSPSRNGKKSIFDPFGGAYGNYTALCEAMRLPRTHNHAGFVGTPELVARTCSIYWSGKSCGKYENLKPVAFPWFLASCHGSEIIVHYKEIIAEHDTA